MSEESEQDLFPKRECEVCGQLQILIVASLPGIPYTAGICQRCRLAGAIPYAVLVGATVEIGGMGQADEWWHHTVEDTLRHLGTAREVFDRDVAETAAAYQRHLEADLKAYIDAQVDALIDEDLQSGGI